MLDRALLRFIVMALLLGVGSGGGATSCAPVACGRSHTLYLTSLNTLFGFGSNIYGQLGYDGVEILPAAEAFLVAVGVVRFGAGPQNTCYIDQGHNLFCFGHNLYKNTDPHSAWLNIRTPRRVLLTGEAVDDERSLVDDVCASESFTCVIQRYTRRVICFGLNVHNIYGYDLDAAGGERFRPVELGDATLRAVRVWCGQLHACGLFYSDPNENNTATYSNDLSNVDFFTYCWGKNDYYQLGHIDTTNEEPFRVGAGVSVRTMAVGFSHTCSLTRHKDERPSELRCWGKSLGFGDTWGTILYSSIEMDVFNDEEKANSARILDVAAGGYNTCFLVDVKPATNDASRKRVKCLGADYNMAGEWNNSYSFPSIYPYQPFAASDNEELMSISMGVGHVCVTLKHIVTQEYAIRCSGYCLSDQCGPEHPSIGRDLSPPFSYPVVPLRNDEIIQMQCDLDENYNIVYASSVNGNDSNNLTTLDGGEGGDGTQPSGGARTTKALDVISSSSDVIGPFSLLYLVLLIAFTFLIIYLILSVSAFLLYRRAKRATRLAASQRIRSRAQSNAVDTINSNSRRSRQATSSGISNVVGGSGGSGDARSSMDGVARALRHPSLTKSMHPYQQHSIIDMRNIVTVPERQAAQNTYDDASSAFLHRANRRSSSRPSRRPTIHQYESPNKAFY